LANGQVLRRAAFSGSHGDSGITEIPIDASYANGRAFLQKRTIHIADILPLLKREYPKARANQARIGWRSLVSVPLMRKGEPIGTINVWRREARAFSPHEIAVLETFAAQAVIAIENARLFNETKEALEQQTAISDVLR